VWTESRDHGNGGGRHGPPFAGGAKVTSSLLASCPVTNSAATVTAAYKDTNTATFTNQKIPGNACGISATANFSGTYKTSANVSDSS
jgi:hypothetical protein